MSRQAGGPLLFEPGPLVEVLGRHGVRYIVIGGIAGRLHGSATITEDLDVCYARDPANLEALTAALRDLRATLRGADPGLPFRLDARTLEMGLNFTFDTLHGSFDCLGEASRSFTYHLLEPNAERMPIGDHQVLVASLDDLIRMKRAAGRPQDLVEVERLSALREVREEPAPYRTRIRRAARTPRRAQRRSSRRAR